MYVKFSMCIVIYGWQCMCNPLPVDAVQLVKIYIQISTMRYSVTISLQITIFWVLHLK